MGLALARIQLIGEQAILKRGSPGAPRLTALGLDREAARRARQRVSAEIVALPLPCSSGSDSEAETSAARDRFRTTAATKARYWDATGALPIAVSRAAAGLCRLDRVHYVASVRPLRRSGLAGAVGIFVHGHRFVAKAIAGASPTGRRMRSSAPPVASVRTRRRSRWAP